MSECTNPLPDGSHAIYYCCDGMRNHIVNLDALRTAVRQARENGITLPGPVWDALIAIDGEGGAR